jgi:hypothetical protein
VCLAVPITQQVKRTQAKLGCRRINTSHRRMSVCAYGPAVIESLCPNRDGRSALPEAVARAVGHPGRDMMTLGALVG